jgi:predicted MFS family arabinose efflux permease
MNPSTGRFRRVRVPLSQPTFRHLWVALLASDFGDSIGRVALVILVFQETGSGFAAALVPALSVVPFLGFGQVLTSYLDRWPRRRVLIGTDLVRAAAFGLMALPIGTPARLVLLTVASAVEPPFLAIRRAITPNTLEEADFSDGIALLSASTEVALLAGAAAGGWLTGWIGASPVMALNALTFVASAVALRGLPLGDVQAPGTTRNRLRIGWTAMWGDPLVRKVWFWFPALSATALGMEAIIAPFVFTELDGGEGLVGLLTGVVSLGVLASAAALRKRSSHVGLFHQMGWVTATGCAIAVCGFFLPTSIAASVLAFAGVGVIYSARIPSQVLYGERLAEESRAAGASLADGGYAIAQITGSLVAGGLVDLFDAGAAAGVIAVAGLLAGIYVLLRPVHLHALAGA